jgi:hypothetical protein
MVKVSDNKSVKIHILKWPKRKFSLIFEIKYLKTNNFCVGLTYFCQEANEY